MIENIRSSFIDMLSDSTWMDQTSKVKAIEKVNIGQVMFFEKEIFLC